MYCFLQYLLIRLIVYLKLKKEIKIIVTSAGYPPLSGANAFALLLLSRANSSLNQNLLSQNKQTNTAT